MKRLNLEETRRASGGKRYRCRVCGYTGYSYFMVIAHCFFHYRKQGIFLLK